MINDKTKPTPKNPEAQHDAGGSVATTSNDAGLSPASQTAGPKPVSPDVRVQATGQTTHE